MGLKGATIPWLLGLCVYYSATWSLWLCLERAGQNPMPMTSYNSKPPSSSTVCTWSAQRRYGTPFSCPCRYYTTSCNLWARRPQERLVIRRPKSLDPIRGVSQQSCRARTLLLFTAATSQNSRRNMNACAHVESKATLNRFTYMNHVSIDLSIYLSIYPSNYCIYCIYCIYLGLIIFVCKIPIYLSARLCSFCRRACICMCIHK